MPLSTPPPGTSFFPTPGPNPFQNGEELALINATMVVRACLPATLVDEDGSPLTVAERAIDSDEPITAPEVTVDFALGESGQTYGDNLMGYDSTSTPPQYLRGLEYRNSHLTVEVRGRSDAERRYLADAVRFGLLAGYGIPTGGVPAGDRIDAVAQVALRQVGFASLRYDATRHLPPAPDAARPEGLLYPTVLSFRCSLWVVWGTPQVTVPAGTVTTVIGY